MAEDIKLEVVTPERSVVDELVKIVMAPGTLGEFGVLSGHTPFLTTLKTGPMQFKDTAGRSKFVFVSGGFAEALADKVTVLAESAERRKDIDVQRARDSAERANERLSVIADNYSGKGEIDYERARASLLRAVQRIQLAELV